MIVPRLLAAERKQLEAGVEPTTEVGLLIRVGSHRQQVLNWATGPLAVKLGLPVTATIEDGLLIVSAQATQESIIAALHACRSELTELAPSAKIGFPNLPASAEAAK